MTDVVLSADTPGGAADALLVALFVDASPDVLSRAAAWLDADLAPIVSALRFEAKIGATATAIVTSGDGSLRRVVLVGMGSSADGADATTRSRTLRDAAMYGAKGSAGNEVVDVLVDGDLSGDHLRAFVEGLVLGAYRAPTQAKKATDPAFTKTFRLLSSPTTEDAEALRRGLVVARRTNWVRDLVTTPAGDLGPAELAEVVRAEAARLGVTVDVWLGDELATKGFGNVIGVGQGSTRAPRVVELRWGADPQPFAITGKGITFDSGGINIKHYEHIAWMKTDMASAAAAAAAVFIAAELDLPVSLHVLLPMAENMPSGTAIRPGDVLHHPNGMTTEVTNTDAEGRLILADCVAYLSGTNPKGIIDIGTLFDAAGYGTSLLGVMGNNQDLLDQVMAAGTTSGDRAWTMPYLSEYNEFLASPVADAVNAPTVVEDTSVMAGTYIGLFAGETPWVHIDNASNAWLELAVGPWPAGATGNPTRLLAAFVERLSSSS